MHPGDEKLIGGKVNNSLLNYPLILWPAKTPALVWETGHMVVTAISDFVIDAADAGGIGRIDKGFPRLVGQKLAFRDGCKAGQRILEGQTVGDRPLFGEKCCRMACSTHGNEALLARKPDMQGYGPI